MLATIAWLSLAIAIASALVIAVDELFRPQKMWIMNIVWPVTALYLSVLTLPLYFRFGRTAEEKAPDPMAEGSDESGSSDALNPSWQQTAMATSHCGAGCTLADIGSEFTVFGLAITIYGTQLWASYLCDFIAAWLLGVGFQYFTIKPMRNLSPWQGLRAAIKADTLSILAFQVGMYAWMALVYFEFFREPHLEPIDPAYWLMMQMGMICGFLTAYPMNRLLIQRGLKEIMK